jgi:hypothetical protein
MKVCVPFIDNHCYNYRQSKTSFHLVAIVINIMACTHHHYWANTNSHSTPLSAISIGTAVIMMKLMCYQVIYLFEGGTHLIKARKYLSTKLLGIY